MKPLVMKNVYYFWNNFKNNLRTLSGWFLTKQPISQNMISLNPEINILTCGRLLYCVKFWLLPQAFFFYKYQQVY